MRATAQRLAVWAGPAAVAIFFSGLLCAQFIPPSSPSSSAEDIAAMYQARPNMIRLGIALQVAAAGLQMPFVAAVATQLSRIGPHVKVFAYTNIGAGAANIILFIIPTILWGTAAYRLDRDPQLILLLHDMAWLCVVVPFTLAFVQNLAIGTAIIMDHGPHPVFPRWLAYFNFWMALLFVPGVAALFFQTGPFAWNGVFAFWLPASVFGSWFITMTVMVLRAVAAEERASVRS